MFPGGLLKRPFYLIVLWVLAMPALSARPYLKIQQVRTAEYPYVKIEISVSHITPVMNLSERNFELYENSWFVSHFQIKHIEPLNDPKNIVLVIDSSRSISRIDFKKQINSVKDFINRLNTNDSMAVISFDDRVNRHCDFSDNKKEILECAGNIKRGGRKTLLYDAIFESLSQTRQLKDARSAVVVFTDGKDEGSVITMDDLVKTSRDYSVPVFVAATGNRKHVKKLTRLTRLSGGEAYHTAKIEDIKKIFQLVGQLLDHSYIITYMSQGAVNAGKDREVKVTVNLKDDKMQDRDSYTFKLPQKYAENWYEKFIGDSRYIHFIVGLGLLLLLLLVLWLFTRKKRKPIERTQEKTSTEAVSQPIDTNVENNQLKDENSKDNFDSKNQKTHNKGPGYIKEVTAWLVEKDGPHTGRRFPLKYTSSVIGSSGSCEIKIDDFLISPNHARIDITPGHQFILYDLISNRGTWLNDKKILRPRELHDFDEIKLGNTCLIFRKYQE